MTKFKVGDKVRKINGTKFGPEGILEDTVVGFTIDGNVVLERSFWQNPDEIELTYTPKDLKDPVNHPSHYGQGSIEAIEYIKDSLTKEEFIGYLRGNISKYLHRWRYKNGVEDLKKAQWYLNKLIEVEDLDNG